MAKEPRADEAEKLFLEEVGGFINTWSQFEGELGMIFVHSTKLRLILASNLFFVPEAFRDKLAMVDVAVKHKLKVATFSKKERLENPIWKEWVRLRNQALRLVEYRNRVAHGIIIENKDIEGNFELLRPIGSVKFTDALNDEKIEPIDLKTLRKWRDKILTLYSDILDWSEAINGKG